MFWAQANHPEFSLVGLVHEALHLRRVVEVGENPDLVRQRGHGVDLDALPVLGLAEDSEHEGVDLTFRVGSQEGTVSMGTDVDELELSTFFNVA